jgi:abortive infection bacteriophage resistance protein
MSHPVIAYNKPALTLADQLQRLHQVKGLVIHDEGAALAALKRIGYNRLLIYMRALQDGRKIFLPGKSFDDVLSLYDFDRKLRLLCMDAIERIEVALRSALANTLTVALGSHFYLNCHHYVSHRRMMEFTSKAAQAKSIAIEHYTRKYNSPSYPPLWTVLESVTYGNLSCQFSPDSDWHVRFRQLTTSRSGMSSDMGFDIGWDQRSFWN